MFYLEITYCTYDGHIWNRDQWYKNSVFCMNLVVLVHASTYQYVLICTNFQSTYRYVLSTYQNKVMHFEHK
jgi:hypothetical protein